LVAHEAFHYLRKTRQVAGRHGEIEADAFALEMLEKYRGVSRPGRLTTAGKTPLRAARTPFKLQDRTRRPLSPVRFGYAQTVPIARPKRGQRRAS
jgi:hypothetical protein